MIFLLTHHTHRHMSWDAGSHQGGNPIVARSRSQENALLEFKGLHG